MWLAVVYAANMIAAAGCLSLGGDHLTNDVARGFGITQVQAESLKEHYGSAKIDLGARAQRLDVKGDGGENRRLVFQAVHMILEGDLQREWGAAERRWSRAVFIGRDLDEAALKAGFEACAA